MGRPRRAWIQAACALLACLPWAASAGSVAASLAGEAIYRAGMLPGHRPLVGERPGGVDAVAAGAACINCHKRSGLGSTEGRITVPPIAGPYLYRAGGARIDDAAAPYVGESGFGHKAYTDESLAAAIRSGVGSDGRTLDYLMPRYALDDRSMEALVAYLKSLAPGSVPGVTDTVLHFATVITPDADPVARQGMLDVLTRYFEDKNAAARAVAPRVYATRPIMYRVNRRWELHVWSLTGAPATWQKQLRSHLAAEPVFAVVSGLGGRQWQPVHDFCEAEAIPCLFPNVEVPVTAPRDAYTVYFSDAVLLEARLIAVASQQGGSAPAPRRLVQVYRQEDAGADAARALRAACRSGGCQAEDRPLRADASDAQLREAVSHVAADQGLVLWLRAADLRRLPDAPPDGSRVWLSGLMGGLEAAPLPQAWRGVARIAYPVDLPERRRVRVDYGLGWFHIKQIPVVAEQVQSDTYLACGLLSEVLNHMVDTFQRDFLVERLDAMAEHRVLTGYYPRLTLATGQSFASKGGYVARFAQPTGMQLAVDGDWIAP
jgi:hypothetical protein